MLWESGRRAGVGVRARTAAQSRGDVGVTSQERGRSPAASPLVRRGDAATLGRSSWPPGAEHGGELTADGELAVPAGSAQQMHGAARPRRLGEPHVGREQGHAENLGQRDLSGVVHRDVVPKFPAPGQQRRVPYPPERQGEQIRKGLFGAAPAEQPRRRRTLTTSKSSSSGAVRS